MPKVDKILTIEITPEQFLNNCTPEELKEVDILIQSSRFTSRMNNAVCRECGCTDTNCEQCIEKTGAPCYWVEKDLCSACQERKLIKG